MKGWLIFKSLFVHLYTFQKYGPDGVFYPLSKQCFSLKDKAYTYEVSVCVVLKENLLKVWKAK